MKDLDFYDIVFDGEFLKLSIKRLWLYPQQIRIIKT